MTDDSAPGPAALYHLHTFHVVATARSFTRAARRLNLSQPSVSAHIRALERHYRAALFEVRHRRVSLTAEGEALFEYSQRIFRLMRDAERAVAETRGLERGELALGASTTIGVYLLPPALALFARRYPGVRVALRVGTSAGVLEQVLMERLPLGLVETLVQHPQLEATVFDQDELVLIAYPDHPWARSGIVSLDALDGAKVLRREAGARVRALLDEALERAGVRVETAMELGSPEALKQAVLAGVGVAWVSRVAVQRELASGALVALATPGIDLRRPLSIISVRGRRLPRAAQAFAALLLERGEPPPDQTDAVARRGGGG